MLAPQLKTKLVACGLKPMEEEATKLKTLLGQSKRVMLTAPAPADGDSIGSQLAVRTLIKRHFANIEVRIVNEDVLLDRYRHLPGANEVQLPREFQPGYFDFAIVVDGGEERLGAAQNLFRACRFSGQIDHHAVGANYPYTFRAWDPRSAATTEVVYRLSLSRSLHMPLDPQVAQSLYVGLIFDTGYFRHENTTPETLEFCAELLRTGFNFSEVGERAMLERTTGGIQLMGRVMAESQLSAGGKVISGVVARELLRRFAARDEDRDGIIDQLTLVEGVEIAVLFHETDHSDVKISFRSRTDFDVAAFARLMSTFGGGHKKAAGCTMKGPLTQTVKHVLASLEAELGQ